ncbi:LysM peptidoglycan-binding domain-containing protein [Seleniivibrio woodruffii]|uniref:LysM peptidoglycan-binding domain-containing protein n=1 Tax=Seleniivibrio woodruffii TaxID=1078050 RepID=UPI0039E4CE82
MNRYIFLALSFLAFTACAPITNSPAPADADSLSQAPYKPKKIQDEAPVLDQQEQTPPELFDKYEMYSFLEDFKSRELDIYNVLKKQTEFHLDQSDTEYGKYDTIALVEEERFNFYVNLYTNRYATTFQRWLNRSNQYIYIVRDIFRREGVPDDLTYLPFTESGFNPSITSHAGACGMWQFMKGTGKMYDLNYNFWVDERRDFEKATTAAARHLKDLYNNLGDWYLALAAYNAGQGKITTAIRRYETRDFYELSTREKTYLRNETKDYVPKFLALRYLARNYQEFGFDTPNGLPMLYEKVTLYSQSNLYVLADLLETDIDTLRELNPELMTPMTPPVGEYVLRVPYGKRVMLENKLEHVTEEQLAQFYVVKAKEGDNLTSIAQEYGLDTTDLKKANGFSVNRVMKDTYVFVPIPDVYDEELNAGFAQELKRYNPKVHTVRRGETFYSIAARYGLTADELSALNNDMSPRSMRRGQSLVISDTYYSDRDKRIPITKPLKEQTERRDTVVRYKVRSGDNLFRIAQKFGTTVASIREANGIRGNSIMVGQSLTISSTSGKAARATSVSKTTKYKVRNGDNLWAIAKKFGTTVDDIKRTNGVGKGIRPGMVLRID